MRSTRSASPSIRGKVAPVGVGLGVFLIVAAALVRFYAYPALAVVPPDFESITRLEATGARIFNSDPSVLAAETSDLEITSRTVADSGAEAPDGTVVWVNSTTVARADGSIFQQSRERAAFGAASGAGQKCGPCDTWIEQAAGEDTPTTFSGQVYKFPFHTEKRSYPVWDSTLRRAVPATFAGEDTVDGLDVYKFVQRIPAQRIETREVPGSVFGAGEASVQAEMWYAMTRTFYVEPQTGSPVNRIEDRVQELRYDGTTVPAFVGTVQYTKAQVDDLVNGTSAEKGAKDNAALLGGMRLLFPLVMFVVGGVLLAMGVLASRGGRRPAGAGAHDERRLVDA